MSRTRLALLAVSPFLVLTLLLRHFTSPEIDPVLLEAEAKIGLDRRVTIKSDLGPGTFKEIWELLAYELEIYDFGPQVWFDVDAFKGKGMKDVWATTVHVPAQKDVEVRVVLRQVLKQIGGTYQLCPVYYGDTKQPFERPAAWIIEVVPERQWWRNSPPLRLWDRFSEKQELAQ